MYGYIFSKSLKTFFLFLGILLITLRTFYFYNIGLSPFPILGVFFLFIYLLMSRGSFLIDKKIISWLSLFLVAIVFSMIDPLFNTKDFNITSFFGLVLGMLLFISFHCYKGLNELEIIKVVKCVLLVHVIFFFYQFISFHIFGNLVDLIEPITGHAQRGIGFIDKEYGGMAAFRATGLFDEPASYCTYVLALTFVAYYNSRKLDLLELTILISVILTLSLTGFALVVAYMLTKKDIKNVFSIKNSMLILIGVVIVLSMFGDLLIGYATQRLNELGSDNSANVRINNFSNILELTTIQLLLGSGIGNNPVFVVEYTFPSLIITFGIVGGGLIVLSFLMIFSNSINYRTLIFFSVLSLNFYTLFNPFTWLFASILNVLTYKHYLTRR
ncbi:hypothetical protein [Cobetia marina]|uniref:hypothetical protein n=1 Tax=Cobetia marina TaxID=28258 RepID=UPI00385748F2